MGNSSSSSDIVMTLSSSLALYPTSSSLTAAVTAFYYSSHHHIPPPLHPASHLTNTFRDCSSASVRDSTSIPRDEPVPMPLSPFLSPSTLTFSMPATTTKSATKASSRTNGAPTRSHAATHPTWVDMIKECIVDNPADARVGVSRPTIKKFIENKYHIDLNPLLYFSHEFAKQENTTYLVLAEKLP